MSCRDNQNPKPLAIHAARGNHQHAAAAGNLILIDARLSPRLSRHTYGLLPDSDLADSLSGSATWTGALVGLTPGAAAVAGDAEIGVNLASMTGSAAFTDLEAWGANTAPGAKGTGTTWGDGDLRYNIAVRGNTFRETGGDAGRLTGIFTGRSHEGVAGTLERSDLTAAFGGAR